MLLSIYYINTIAINYGSYNNNNIIVNNYNIVYANSLTNNRVLYIDNSGKLNTTDIEPDKLTNMENDIAEIKAQLSNQKSYLLDAIYPIGAIYISIDNTSPATLFGGTWVAIDDGYYLRASNSGGGNILSEQLPNITGTLTLGARSRMHSGTNGNGALTVDSHGGGGFTGNYSETAYSKMIFDAHKSNPIYTDNAPVQPKSVKVYMWKRTN